MSHFIQLRATALGVGTSIAIFGLMQMAMSQAPPSLPAHPVSGVIPTQILSDPIDDSTVNITQLRRGQYLVAAGDCMSCHLRAGGEPFAGGLALETPFGTIYSSNITGDRETGIGGWTSQQFYLAMHDGIGPRGEYLYPAFPYPWFRRVARADTDAILAYLKTTPAVRYTPPANELHFPLNFRTLVGGWNVLYLRAEEFEASLSRSEEWNRGAYLVN